MELLFWFSFMRHSGALSSNWKDMFLLPLSQAFLAYNLRSLSLSRSWIASWILTRRKRPWLLGFLLGSRGMQSAAKVWSLFLLRRNRFGPSPMDSILWANGIRVLYLRWICGSVMVCLCVCVLSFVESFDLLWNFLIVFAFFVMIRFEFSSVKPRSWVAFFPCYDCCVSIELWLNGKLCI